MKKEVGFSLVSLVITIIILIILAGISVNTLIGDGGIITKAQQAKENILLAQEEEAMQLNELYSQLNYIGGNTEDVNGEAVNKLVNFKKVIATAISKEGIITQENDSAEVMANNIGKILEERTKNATATAENISSGKTAWVNGQLIIGTNEKYSRQASAEIPEGITNVKIIQFWYTAGNRDYLNITGEIMGSISYKDLDNYNNNHVYAIGVTEYTIKTNGKKGKLSIAINSNGGIGNKSFYYLFY